jgi:hypothetical protein
MLLRIILCAILSICLVYRTQAQASNYRLKWVKRSEQWKQADSLSIFPASIQVVHPAGAALPFSYNPQKNSFVWSASSTADSVLVGYRVLPFHLGNLQYHRNPASYDSNAFYQDEKMLRHTLPETREEFFATKGINKTGSISRGISMGNTQNVFVNSALNLQLEGQLSDNVHLLAVISDQNVPFQPEGNTQQLQEFDKVFVQLSGKKSRLIAGDLVLQQPLWRQHSTQPSHFLRYYKNVQGGQAEASYTLSKEVHAQTSAGIAISKGKFASMLVEVTEGVQGPYKLRGPANEKFIIILANSEKVYLDGRLLQRGFDYDYIIDYNLAEITFNTNTVITQFSRVRVDFEYSDRVYSRSIINTFHRQQMGKLQLFANYYSEKDNPRNPITITLTDADKHLLSEIGDSLQRAVVSGVTLLDGYTANQILYEKIDTILDNSQFSIYKQSTNAQTALYQLQFSDVGIGRGNYLQKNTTANGKVFEWIAPQNGIPQGQYEPVKLISTPTKKQMVTMGAEYQVSRTESIYTEMAFSDRDINLYSPLDGADNKGAAFKGGYSNRGKTINFLPKYQWISSIDYEFNGRNFQPIDRFRDIEFDRDWSIRIDTTQADDQIFQAMLGIRKGELLATDSIQPTTPTSSFAEDKLIYRFSFRDRGSFINGTQQRVEAAKKIGNLQVNADMFLLHTTRLHDNSTWQRLQINAAYHTRYLIPGYSYSLDKNKLSSLARKDSVIGTAMNFEAHQFYLKTPDTLKTRFTTDYSFRQDYFPSDGKLIKNTFAHTANIGLQTTIRQHNAIHLLFTYRTVEYQRNIEDNRPEENLMGRIDWNGNWFSNHIRSELTLAAGTGRELKREYVFLPVPAGEGTHTWRDDNSDGLQELNEFYEAINPDEKNFAKFFVPTDQYIRAYTNNLTYRLNITAPRHWQEQGALKDALSRVSAVSSWVVNKKITDNSLISRITPFTAHLPEENILSTQDALRTTVFYNRASPRYGFDINVFRTVNKQLLTNGFESRGATEIKLNTRLTVHKDISIRTSLGRGLKNNASDFLPDRNYQIFSQQLSPEIAYQPSASFRLSGMYLYGIKKNNTVDDSPERAIANQFGLETRWAKVSKRTLSAGIKYIQIAYNGQINTPLGYEMLEALRPGNNWNWSFNLQQKLTNGLQVSLQYEGRKSEAQRLIHVGRMQVAALF